MAEWLTCKCGCPYPAHRQHLGKGRVDSCDEHGPHYMDMCDEDYEKYLIKFGFIEGVSDGEQT